MCDPFAYLLPWSAVYFGAYVPYSVKQIASEQTLKALDYSMLEPSRISVSEQQRLRDNFNQVLSAIHTQHEHFILMRV